MRNGSIVSLEWLHKRINEHHLVICDCRFLLGEPFAGQEQYKEEHIPHAFYFDLERDLSGPVGTHGGRHPLPSLESFVHKLEQSGIDETKTVVVYDDQDGAMAARLWWMLKYVGHEHVYVLDEGFTAWKQKGYPTTKSQPTPKTAQFEVNVNQGMIASYEDVERSLTNDAVVLIDSRAPQRYTGEHEDIDKKAGHIPGAINEFWKHGLKEGKWLNKEEQKKRLASFIEQHHNDKHFIVYCGSGVTACANVIAFEEVGVPTKLYVGSWSDWITHSEAPLEK